MTLAHKYMCMRWHMDVLINICKCKNYLNKREYIYIYNTWTAYFTTSMKEMTNTTIEMRK